MSAKGEASARGPWPEKKTPRERLAIEAARLQERWERDFGKDPSRAGALAEEARNRLTQPLQLIASGGDAEALETFAQSELGEALLRRADLSWAIKTCDRAAPAAREAIARAWIEPAALGPANSEGERWPAEGALKCLASIVARAEPSEEGALAACERALARSLSGLQDQAALLSAAGALSMSLPKADPLVFGRMCRWLLSHGPARAAGPSAVLLAAWAADALAGRHGERDAKGMERVGQCAKELLSAIAEELSATGEGGGRELSVGQAWACCERLSRVPGAEPELARMESRFAADGFWLSDEDLEELTENWQGQAKLFWGQLWGDQEPGRGARLSLASAALFQGDLARAKELIERGCWWGEEAFFEMAQAFRGQEQSGAMINRASARQMGLLDRSVALGEALALSLQGPGSERRGPARSI